MYQRIITPRQNPIVTPEQLAAFGRFDCPQQYEWPPTSSPLIMTADYGLLETFIEAATDQVETMAAEACTNEQVLLTLDFFPNTQDPRNWLQYELTYAFAITPWWWWGFPTKDSIELVRRPVLVPQLSGSAVAVTAVSLENNIVTVTTALNPAVGSVVLLANTAEGNVSEPSQTPSTVPFINGVPLTVLSSSETQFTATFNNFYAINGQGNVVPGSYANNSDSGTAQVWSDPLVVTYNDQNGVLQTWNSTNYSVMYDKVCLNVGLWWPLTDRRQDCIQISYWAGHTACPSRLQMAVLYLANHMWENRSIVAVEPTSEIARTLCLMLSSYRSFRLPR